MIGCDCRVCRSDDPRDKRLRSSAFVEYGGLKILVDAGPDFRTQMLRAGIRHIDAILLTHNHKDHTGGLDDVRAFNYIERAPIRIYCEKYVEDSLRQEYSYAFAERPFTVSENIPEQKLVWVDGKGYDKIPVSAEEWAKEHHPEEAGKGTYRPKQVEVIPIRGRHFMLPVLGYRFGNIAYLTDMNYIPETEFARLEGLDHFIINCVRRGKHLSHFSLEEAVAVARKVGARHSWLTHLSHQLPRYEDLCRELPEDIRPAYDGLTIESVRRQ